MPTQATFTPPPANRYVAAFQQLLNINDRQKRILRAHYHSPDRTVTARQLAELAGYGRYTVVNAQYGRLARLVGEQLDYHPEPERLGTLVTFEKRHGEWHWLMRPEVAEALERVGWVEGVGFQFPEEISAATSQLVEGAAYRVLVNAYERNPEARRRCIAAHGTTCSICGFSFGKVYGEVAEGYIHVHHLRALSETNGEYVIDAVADLRPVCPNCHAVLHRRIPAFTIDEVKEFLSR